MGPYGLAKHKQLDVRLSHLWVIAVPTFGTFPGQIAFFVDKESAEGTSTLDTG